MIDINKSWFPASDSANNFGWDPITAEHLRKDIWPRIHLGDDFWPKDGRVFAHPFKTLVSGKVKFIRDDGTKDHNSLLIQYAGAFEVQYWHVRENELSKEIKDALISGAIVPAGTIIGPCGDVGIGTGRHVHLVVKAADGTDLAPLLGDDWKEDKKDAYAEKYGKIFTEKADADNRQIKWMNEKVIYRHVGYNGPMAYYVNPRVVLGEGE